MKILIWLILTIGPMSLLAQRTKSLVIDVSVDNIRSSKGGIVVGLFNTPEGFPEMKHAYKIAIVETINGKATARFVELEPGVYAISVFHDENSNKKLDRNMFGIPKEGVGVSNNAKGNFGPAKFRDAGFVLSEESKSIQISLTYLHDPRQ